MRKSGRIVGKFSRGVSCDPERVVAFLRSRHPTKMPEAVEADTGIAAATVRKWPASAPSFAAFLRLVGAYGPELLCACMEAPPAWLDDAARRERRARVTAQIADLSNLLEQDSA
ncbi:hypothetical protein GCM10008179_28460 [Hansschlegelia plantiphila]|uniref:Uncharacterized protein n=2 Tax=Hansschlegelia plantiphila TaxID=374655 RepID=A0A9W6MWN9_9HYPH|nr:hypothetical protein GCM10008179_28460 [Hansschlegelia plantiphila]